MSMFRLQILFHIFFKNYNSTCTHPDSSNWLCRSLISCVMCPSEICAILKHVAGISNEQLVKVNTYWVEYDFWKYDSIYGRPLGSKRCQQEKGVYKVKKGVCIVEKGVYHNEKGVQNPKRCVKRRKVSKPQNGVWNSQRCLKPNTVCKIEKCV